MVTEKKALGRVFALLGNIILKTRKGKTLSKTIRKNKGLHTRNLLQSLWFSVFMFIERQTRKITNNSFQSNMNTKVRVKGKASPTVLNWGGPPFALRKTKRGLAYIPNGFKLEVKRDKMVWIGEIMVKDIDATNLANNEVLFRFYLKSDPSKLSDWHVNPTAAYKDVSNIVNNTHFNKGSNGQLLIGITYGEFQKIICETFRLDPNPHLDVEPPMIFRSKTAIRECDVGRVKTSPGDLSVPMNQQRSKNEFPEEESKKIKRNALMKESQAFEEIAMKSLESEIEKEEEEEEEGYEHEEYEENAVFYDEADEDEFDEFEGTTAVSSGLQTLTQEEVSEYLLDPSPSVNEKEGTQDSFPFDWTF